MGNGAERSGENKKTGGREGIEEAGIEEEDEEEGWRLAFWNVAGIGNKDKDFWGVLEQWDAMVLIETWVEESSWTRLKEKLPKGYEWGVQYAKRKRKREGR